MAYIYNMRYIHSPTWQMFLAKMRFLCIKSVGWQKKTGGSSAIDGGIVRDLNTAGGIQVVGSVSQLATTRRTWG